MNPNSGHHSEGRHDPVFHPREAVEAQQATLLRLVRMTGLVLFVTIAILTSLDLNPDRTEGLVEIFGYALNESGVLIIVVAMVIGGLVLVADTVAKRKKISTLAGVFVGLVIAMLATWLLAKVIDLITGLHEIENETLIAATKILIGIALAYLCVSTVIQTQDDFRLVIPYVEFAKEIRGPKPLVLDTSVLIDGRIVDIANTGILQCPLVIPSFVVGELQMLSDAPDKLRRAKGKRGLDVIARLQRSALDLTLEDDTRVPGKAVDQMLVEFARQMPAMLATSDQPLARIASIQGVSVLNLNELAGALKPSLLPGQHFEVRLVKEGEQEGQAVGYLEDGTMVVAEDATDLVGRSASLEVTSAIQTAGGRMIFARLAPSVNSGDTPRPSIQAEEDVIEPVDADDETPDEQDASDEVPATPVSERASGASRPQGSGRRQRKPSPRNPRR